MSAPTPPADLARRSPAFLDLPAKSELHRFHAAGYDPIFFDPSLKGRLNAPDGAYGVLYTAREIEGGFAEAFLRTPGRTILSPADLKTKAYALLATKKPLRVLRLAGPGLARVGATAEVVHGGLPYTVPQAWSVALHAWRPAVDGIAYNARHDDTALCYALFDRARDAVREVKRLKALDRDWFWAVAEKYGVGRAPS